MGIDALVGKAQSVLGPIAADDIGITLAHEHLLLDLSVRFQPPQTISERARAKEPVSFDNIGWVRYHPMSCLDNLQLTDEAMAAKELTLYRNFGGCTIVDMTNVGLGRDPLALARISRATGVNVIMGAGYYTEATWPAGVNPDEDEMVEEIVRDITVGVGRTGIKAGMIGEIGTEWPINDGERRSLRAAARAQQRTGAPINVHTGNSPSSGLLCVDILGESGADIGHVVMSHCDGRIYNYEILRRLAQTGCYIEYDGFGFEGWYERRAVWSEENPIKCDFPNDAGRISNLMKLIDDGFLDQILISHDVCLKFQTRSYGGPGYAHILENVIPLMQKKGLSDDHIRRIVVENPKRMLCFD